MFTPANAFVVTVTDTGTQDDYAPVEFTGQPVVIRADNASALTITGFANPIDGQQVTVMSVGTADVLFSNQSGSAAANQLVNFVTSGVTPLAAGLGTATYVYDGVSSRWRLVSHEQGGWIAIPYNASDFTALSPMTWTVAAGDVITEAYYLKGRTLTVALELNTTTVGGTPATQLRFILPNGWKGAKKVSSSVYVIDNGVRGTGVGSGFIGVGHVAFYTPSAGNWSLATDTTFVFGQATLELE